MTTTDKTVDWLAQEVTDLLDASSVGLYEFLDLLQDPDQPLPADAQRDIAHRTLERLISEGSVELHWMRWPASESLGTVSLSNLPADPWHRPDADGRYLALATAD